MPQRLRVISAFAFTRAPPAVPPGVARHRLQRFAQLYERGLVHSQRLNLSLHGDKISLCLRTLACADAGGIIYVTATEVKLVMMAIQTWCEGLAKLRL